MLQAKRVIVGRRRASHSRWAGGRAPHRRGRPAEIVRLSVRSGREVPRLDRRARIRPERAHRSPRRGETVASADVPSRRVSYDVCAKAPLPQGYSQRGVRYTRMKSRATITCRFPGRFLVTVYPVSPSWTGELPAGSAVGLVLGRRLGTGPSSRRTILASATVLRRSGESDVVFARRNCSAATNR
jgi:hypothetical protein